MKYTGRTVLLPKINFAKLFGETLAILENAWAFREFSCEIQDSNLCYSIPCIKHSSNYVQTLFLRKFSLTGLPISRTFYQ